MWYFTGFFSRDLWVGSCPENPTQRFRAGTPGCAKQWLEDGVARLILTVARQGKCLCQVARQGRCATHKLGTWLCPRHRYDVSNANLRYAGNFWQNIEWLYDHMPTHQNWRDLPNIVGTEIACQTRPFGNQKTTEWGSCMHALPGKFGLHDIWTEDDNCKFDVRMGQNISSHKIP